MLHILRAKLHCIRVTSCDFEYHGSVTLDPDICHEVGMYPLEFVYIWNKNNGQRFSTYVLYGNSDSRCCVLNGAAARLCQPGDELIISAYEYVNKPEEIYDRQPRILTFDADNTIVDRLRYVVSGKDDGRFDCSVQGM